MTFLNLLLPTTIACALNACANVFWKLQFQKQPLVLKLEALMGLIIQPNIIIGVCFYVLSMLIFFYLLSNYALSIIIPLTAMTYLFNMLLAFIVFKESFDAYKLIGMAIIILGIAVLSQSKGLA
ncbi:EamA family transporter [Sulfurospirillum sp.]|uniref:EamA family transporter n=1 Tax=Sulfurospirillum sp. TaxID=2053622 RepID=UPI002FDE4BF0